MTRRLHKLSPRGFTLMEMMVAVALVVLVIIGVSILTQSMGTMVSTSQASNEMLSNVRGVEYRIERDFAGIDRNGFIAIRSRLVGTRRFDMISFISNGTFPNRTGTAAADGSGAAVSLFNDYSTANAALVWYGHLTLELLNGDPAGNYLAPDVGVKTALDILPSGVKESDLILGRRAMLLMSATGAPASAPFGRVTVFPAGGPATGILLPAYTTPAYGAARVNATSTEPDASITSSRIAIASMTPAQVMSGIVQGVAAEGGRGSVGGARFEANSLCYRLHALANVYGDGLGNYAANYFRTHPQMLQGCTNFVVEWTDGTPDTNSNLTWYGLGNAKGDTTIEPDPNSTATGDNYTAVFSFDNKAKWPKAIRLTYTVNDRNNRLNGGRTFSQVLRLPS